LKIPRPAAAQVEAFAQRVITGLPDSLSAQKSDLVVLIEILPRNTGARKTALAMWSALTLAEKAQAEFCFPNTDQNHNGKEKP
jgi:hypothetical protein